MASTNIVAASSNKALLRDGPCIEMVRAADWVEERRRDLRLKNLSSEVSCGHKDMFIQYAKEVLGIGPRQICDDSDQINGLDLLIAAKLPRRAALRITKALMAAAVAITAFIIGPYAGFMAVGSIAAFGVFLIQRDENPLNRVGCMMVVAVAGIIAAPLLIGWGIYSGMEQFHFLKRRHHLREALGEECYLELLQNGLNQSK